MVDYDNKIYIPDGKLRLNNLGVSTGSVLEGVNTDGLSKNQKKKMKKKLKKVIDKKEETKKEEDNEDEDDES